MGSLDWLDEAIALLDRGLADFEAGTIPASALAALVAKATRVERAGTTLRTLLGTRVTDTQPHRGTADKSAAEWLARQAGLPVGRAIGELETAERLAEQPVLDRAARAGQLSAPQLAELSAAVSTNPGAADELLDAAGRMGFNEFSDTCRKAKAAGESEAQKLAREQRIRRNRRCRSYVGADGAAGLDILGPADEVAQIRAGLERYRREAFDAARKAGRREPAEAYGFDGLVAMARDALAAFEREHGITELGQVTPEPAESERSRGTKGPGGTSKRAKRLLRNQLAHLVVPAEAILADADEPGPTFELLGVGAISRAKAAALLPDALWDLVITKGIDVASYTHLGRNPTTAQLISMLIRDGGRCVVEGCVSPVAETDHEPPWARTKRTRLDELRGLCKPHHDMKTRGLGTIVRDLGGRWVWTARDSAEARAGP